MFFLYSARSPHRTAKPSRGCLPLAHPRALPAVLVSDRRSPSAMCMAGFPLFAQGGHEKLTPKKPRGLRKTRRKTFFSPAKKRFCAKRTVLGLKKGPKLFVAHAGEKKLQSGNSYVWGSSAVSRAGKKLLFFGCFLVFLCFWGGVFVLLFFFPAR